MYDMKNLNSVQLSYLKSKYRLDHLIVSNDTLVGVRQGYSVRIKLDDYFGKYVVLTISPNDDGHVSTANTINDCISRWIKDFN